MSTFNVINERIYGGLFDLSIPEDRRQIRWNNRTLVECVEVPEEPKEFQEFMTIRAKELEEELNNSARDAYEQAFENMCKQDRLEWL